MNAVRIPFMSLVPGEDAAAVRGAIDRVIERGWFILGPEVEAFEREFAMYVGARECVGVANGTEAITIALRALGVGEGDEVVVPSFTFYASAEAIPPTGAKPVFCDVDPVTFCVTPDTVRAALTPSWKRALACASLVGSPEREMVSAPPLRKCRVAVWMPNCSTPFLMSRS